MVRRGWVGDWFTAVAIAVVVVFIVTVLGMLFLKGAEVVRGIFGTVTVTDPETGKTYEYDTGSIFSGAVPLFDYLGAGLIIGVYLFLIISLARLPVVKESLPAWLVIGLILLYFTWYLSTNITDAMTKQADKMPDYAKTLTEMPVSTTILANLPYIHLVFFTIGTILFYGKEISASGGLSW